jgi:arylsulfatase A-like enzyme
MPTILTCRRSWICLLLIFLGLLPASFGEDNGERPNILLFVVDDMGWTDTSVPFWEVEVDNNRYFHTPHMARLAAESYVFTQAYSSSPVCSPSRTAMMTGQNPMRSGITNWIPGEKQEVNSKYLLPEWNKAGLTPEHVTLPRLLAESGYATVHIGKAHFGLEGSAGADPKNLGFGKSYAGTHIGSPATFYPPYVGENERWAIPDLQEYADKGMYLTDAITSVALNVLDSLSRQDTPFFIHLSHYAVHTPIQAKEKYVEKFRRTGKTETEAKYAAMVQSMDESLGEVMGKLKHLGMDENTIIVFASDNGGHVIKASGSPTGNYPVSGGKGFWYEGGYRVPFMIKIPRAESKRIAYPAISEDIFSTILSLAEAKVPDHHVVDGVDLMSEISKGEEARKQPLIWHYPHYWAGAAIREAEKGIGPFTAIRMGDWKYIYTYDDQQSFLYYLNEDISEQKNLLSEQPKIARELVDFLVAKMKAVEASRPIDRDTGQQVPYPGI